MTARQLTDYGESVLMRLRMSEWVAGTIFEFVSSLPDDAVAMAPYLPDTRSAAVKVLRNRKHRPSEREIQETVIHECLHLRLEGHHDMGKERDPNYEYAINCLSEVLWEAWNQ